MNGELKFFWRVLRLVLLRLFIKVAGSKSLRRKIRAFAPKLYCDHPAYGRIYLPIYPSRLEMGAAFPKIYNADGEAMEIFFIRDDHSANNPYGSGSKYFLWDRYNVALKTHFYGGNAILDAARQKRWAEGIRRYAILPESVTIAPYDYLAFEKFKGIHKDFEAVLTFSEKLLETLPNAKFFPGTSLFYGNEVFGNDVDPVKIDPEVWRLKDKNISMVCTKKATTEMHRLRQRFADEVLRSRQADVFGSYQPTGMFKFKSETLQRYRYQIVVENDLRPYYFTEKIIDCFAAMTIPIYLGASKIKNFFNADGIIFVEKDSDLPRILAQCDERDYLSRLEAVRENFERARAYFNSDDLLYEILFRGRILEK